MKQGLRARLAHALDRRFAALSEQVGELREGLRTASAERDEQRQAAAQLADAVAELRPAIERVHDEAATIRSALAAMQQRLDGEILALLRELLIDDAGNRRRLDRLRSDPRYERPFRDPDPLVSICIPARADRVDLLVERAIPSALAQTYEHVEVIVTGDGFDLAGDPRLQSLGDPRLRVHSTTHRSVDPDPHRAWLTGATLPRMEARGHARGLWITDLDDDDALRPDAVASLVEHAQATRAEVTAGLIAQYEPGAPEPTTLRGFPPEIVPDWSGLEADWQGRASTAALTHSGLQFFTRFHAAALLGTPGDLFLTIRMARAGVRFAVVDRVVYDYYPGSLWEAPGAAPGRA